jgi:ABC-type Zn uptake system ZnuABC Zn-binding protein ZnuA/ABC-type Mn2+/Zn2+ transport system permease subunit
VFDLFQLPFAQRALVEVLVLAVAAGLVGCWIVLRGLAFFSHAVGTAAFPGLVLADGLSFAPTLGAFGVALLFALAVARLAAQRRTGYDSLTALVLVGALAAGVILASDVFQSGSQVDALLFGSLLVVGTDDIVLAAAASVLVLGASLALGRRWLAIGFDPDGAPGLGLRSPAYDIALLGLVAVTAVAALSIVGALLATALLVVPAATTRLWTDRLGAWQATTIVFAAASMARTLRPRLRPGPALAGAALLGALGLAGCGYDGGGANGDQVKVVATTTQIADFVREVGGRDVEVTQLLKPNTDPHEYEPRPADVRATAGSKIVFRSGGDLDEWMGELVDQAGGDPKVVDLGAAVPVRLKGEDEPFDPHWWHDPLNAQAAVERIRDALVAADPAHKAEFERNADAYRDRLRALNLGLVRCFTTVPFDRRKLVSDHDAFNYFTSRYDIRYIGAVIPSQTTEAQPSAGEVADLVALIRREKVAAVFPEESLSPKLAESIARQTGATANYTLYGDALGPKGSAGDTYLRMEQANADAMVRGFTGGRRRCRVAGIS